MHQSHSTSLSPWCHLEAPSEAPTISSWIDFSTKPLALHFPIILKSVVSFLSLIELPDQPPCSSCCQAVCPDGQALCKASSEASALVEPKAGKEVGENIANDSWGRGAGGRSGSKGGFASNVPQQEHRDSCKLWDFHLDFRGYFFQQVKIFILKIESTKIFCPSAVWSAQDLEAMREATEFTCLWEHNTIWFTLMYHSTVHGCKWMDPLGRTRITTLNNLLS